jgi:LysM repeat protein
MVLYLTCDKLDEKFWLARIVLRGSGLLKKGVLRMQYDQPMTKITRSITLLICLTLLLTLALSVFPQSQAAAVTCKYKHKVQQGETLSYIANLYGISWIKIADANNLQAPYTVVPGQVLCIPEGEKNASSTPTSKKGKEPILTVSSGITNVLVSVENFPKKTSYYVRVYPSDRPVSYRLGVFTTNKEGDFTDWFKLPLFVRRTATMTLCVKNVWTDAASCMKYPDLVYNFPFIHIEHSPKEGR